MIRVLDKNKDDAAFKNAIDLFQLRLYFSDKIKNAVHTTKNEIITEGGLFAKLLGFDVQSNPYSKEIFL